MTSSRDASLANLRQSIDSLPERTRRAMLAGIGGNTVITGAFSDGSGVCPMLAAQRQGDRVRCMSFPEAWDRFTGVHGRCISRPASAGEVRTLKIQLEESLSAVHGRVGEFTALIAEHEATVAANRRFAAAEAQVAAEVAAHEVEVAARRAQREADRNADERRGRRRREHGGFVADFAGAITDHLAIARTRRGREATQTGLDWLFEETLVLPEDFDRDVATDAEEFDFSREPATVIPPDRPRGRSILK